MRCAELFYQVYLYFFMMFIFFFYIFHFMIKFYKKLLKNFICINLINSLLIQNIEVPILYELLILIIVLIIYKFLNRLLMFNKL